ncbi:translation elongation factor Ts [candidate division KSB1 bacterium]|nr:translation elongation factor Ts [candidate division KSB1 bacterium]NIR68464.1 translation elongation factor Ts [candidate division KSB1 bacterium]NIS25115.1 translation elongation factor Ts [candidate division KSB1 bacterium]NIT72027.1 translation elongation factor Ts [candidate division KSB1 bacterium]NIU25814.1 translation elongation factor Ts [candidate division KSB1 bacterium]
MSVSAEKVKILRERTGVGIMDCKSVLEETDGDIEKAVELLRKKGIASAEKRAGRETNEGIVDAYIHPGSRIGVLVEVNCETDFVAKTEDFQKFVHDMAMQIAATNPRVVTRDEYSKEEIEKEMEIFRTQAKNEGKPEHIIERFSQGKLEKFYQETVLLEQSYIRDPGKNVKELLTELIAKTGENININRFVRFQLGT